MGTIIGWLVGRKLFGTVIGERGASVIAHAGLVLVVLAMVGGVVAWIRSDALSDHQAHQVQRGVKATNKAADERVTDALKNSKSEQEMHDAVRAQPDQPIAPTSHALACERLRRRGHAPASCG
jgi:uncharacterized protein HemX